MCTKILNIGTRPLFPSKKKSETKEFKNYVCIFEFENYTQSLSHLMFKSLKLITNNFIP